MIGSGSARRVVVASDDPMILERLEGLAADFELELAGESAPAGETPFLLVVDLERPGALAEVSRWRERHPQALVAGHLSSPLKDLWLAGERAGCDLVANRGAFALQLRRRLAAWRGPGRRRFPLFESADAAGRPGLVYRTDDSPVGPVAVFRAGGGLHAVEDRCPHAGSALSGGPLEGVVITCPRHGSQFDVRTGDRLRGPADEPVRTHRLLEEGGRVHLLTEEP